MNFTHLLNVKQIDDHTFESIAHIKNFRGSLYGGQILAQCLMAAMKTVNHRYVHSMHAYFLNSGDSTKPLYFQVESIREGRTISNKRITARQRDQVTQKDVKICELQASFHESEHGLHHINTQDIGCSPSKEQAALHNIAEFGDVNPELSPFIIVPDEPDLFLPETKKAAYSGFWIKSVTPLPQQNDYQIAALTFASDLGLLATSLLPHGLSLFSPKVSAASIDHALWFHNPTFDLSDWVYCAITSPWADLGRGFSQAQLFNKDGVLLASSAQEGLLRISQ